MKQTVSRQSNFFSVVLMVRGGGVGGWREWVPGDVELWNCACKVYEYCLGNRSYTYNRSLLMPIKLLFSSKKNNQTNNNKKTKQTETELTVGVLKTKQKSKTHKRLNRTLFNQTKNKTKYANFRGNPLLQSHKPCRSRAHPPGSTQLASIKWFVCFFVFRIYIVYLSEEEYFLENVYIFSCFVWL